MFKPKGHHVRQSQVEKFTRYSIRKVSFGAASVAVATGLFFLGGGSVQAAEQLTNPEPTKVQNPQNVNDKSPEPSKEVSGQESATDKAADVQKTSSAKESATDTQASEVKNPNVEAEKVTINTASLEDLVAKAESRLSQLTEGKKTKSVIDDAKNLVNKAKELLNDDTKTQVKVDSLAKQLSSSLVILNSIKSDTTDEEKVNKNQDSRNGKAIPGKGESGFRATTYKLDDSNNAQLPDTATTGTDKFTFVALPENDPGRNSGAIAKADGAAGKDIVVTGTGKAPTDLEIELYSSQRTGQKENPVAMSTVNGEPATSSGRMDYPLSKEQVQKLQEEAKLWRNKEKPDGNRISNNPAEVFGNTGAYEFLATEIYKLGYEQGVDRVYIPNISNRFGVTEKATQAGWKIKSIEPFNLPPGLIYDRESDSIQGRVVANLQNGVYDLRFNVAAENERTHQIVSMKFQNLRSGWIGWQDTQPPKIEVSNDAYEATVGQDVNIEVKYSDNAGSNFSGDKRRVKYTLKDGRVVEIPNQSYRQAVSGLAGYPTTKNQGPAQTSIPGVTYDLSRDKTPTEKEANGDEKIFGKGILTGSPTKAGIYTVSVFAKDYNNRSKADATWIHSGHEVQKYMTVVVKPTATIKNIHAYSTNIPVTISDGASTAELTLPNGKVIKLEARNGNWTLADGGAVLGPVGGEINIPVSQEDTKDAAVDTIKVKAITENVKATLLRKEIELLGDDGQKHTARLSETTGHWELEDAYKEVRTPTADGGYKLTKRQVYTEVQTDNSTNYYIYSYTRTFNADDKVVSVDEVTRPKTVVPRLNTENTEGATTTVEYDAVTKEWKSSDGSNVMATKEGDFWKVRTDSGFIGLIKGSKAESVEDKGSILNDAPTAISTSYTAVKGATVDLVKQASAAVTIRDTEDDATTSPKKETTVTKVTVTSPSGQRSEYTDLEQAKAHLLSEVGTYTVKVEVKDSNGNVVTANTETETGTDKGAETAVNSTTYTITVKDQETKKLYKVEDDTVTNDELKGKVEPTTIDGFTPTKNDFTNIPTTEGKAGQTIPTSASVTYTKGTETIPVETKVDVVVLPKVEPTGVTVLKDSTGLEEAVKAKAVEAANAVPSNKLPDGVTISVKEVKQGTVPATSTNGVQTPATVVVEYKDVNNNVVATKEVTVPVTVVSSTPSKIVVFEGEKPTADQAKAAVTPGADGTKGEPTALPETAGKAGATDVKVDVPVTYDNGKLTETVSVPVTVLPKASGEVEVPKGESVAKVKEVAKAKAAALVEAADFKGKLPTGATVTVGDITEEVLATITAEKGTNKGVVNVPATYTVDGKTYPTTIPVTINVLGSETKPVYTVEGTKPDAEKVKNAVTPGTGGTTNAPTEAGLPDTTGKAGATDVTATTTVTYPNGTETVTVPVTVLPKATPEKVITLKDTTGDNLTTAVKEKAQAALGKLTLPTGVTVELVPNQDYTVPATDSNGDKDAVPVKVQYKDATGTVVAEDTINVPVTVVGSTPSNIVVFEGEKPTADQAKAAVTPGTDGTKGEPTTLPETAGKAGATDVKVDVPVTYDNGKLTETVSVPVTVLPKPEADEILVAKNSDKEKAKEKVLAQAEKAIADGTFTGKLPQGATVTVDNTVPVTIPELTNDTEVEVTVKYTVPGQDTPLTTTVKVPVTVVEGVPQIVPVKENNDVLPDPEKSIDKTDYPEGSTFRYKTPDGQTSPIDVTTTGDKNVVVEVLDPQGNTIVEVPATVRVVGSTPQFVVADPAKKQPEAKDSVTPGEYPDGTTFEYKTPVDTTTAGEKDVTVVAKLNGQPIAEVPAKVVVVDPKTQYVVADPSKPQPDASKSIDPEQYPDGTTFEYKTPVDTTTPGEKDVVVVAKDGEDKLVEVPTKVKVVQGNPQIVPVDEGKKQPSPEDSIDPNDYPDDATFEYKEEVDTSTPGDKKVTVVVKQGDKVLVEVPSTVRVVESYPKYVPVDPAKKQPDPKENINPNDFPTGTTFEYKDNTPVDTTTPGEKDVTVVAKLNGQPITEIPAKIVVVEPKTQYVPVNAEGDKKPKPQDSITPDDYPEGSTFEYKTPEGQTTPYDGTTPGEKDVTVVVKDPDGDKLVEVPAKIKVVQGKEQLTPVNAEDKDKPKAEDSITPSDYPEGSTFEYKVPEGQTTPYDGTTPGDKPVTVVVKDKDGKVLVEVPATIKVVETKPTPIETPVTNTPLTEDDYTKGMKIPEGATVKVGDLPDLTTPGEKTPVKVTITLPNGKSYTVDVPVTVTPVKEIETPVTTTPLTPEDYTKGIKIPEGGKVTKVENIPDLTTPGKKDPVKVTVTLPNGKVVTVDVPVTVTPVKEIETPVTTTPLTPDDYTKGITIPEGGKVTKVENIPDLTTPGKKDPVKVTIELPNGKVITVDVPVTVTPVKEIETPVTTTPLTPEDYTKGIKIPEGGKVTKVENIPDLTTPGKKDPVKVTIELPNGKVITVDVPV
ncbi:Rib/alpha-like domain-containing protein, partial [Streptococcus mitis]|uniref:Rib/alpha-like domain-containing protein n=1 Tax=Streptococcus mitis TaxID=28037 RepID=UPI0021B61748